MIIFVGSTNPVKTNAVIQAVADHWPSVRVQGFEVPSEVKAQPNSDQETKQGAINRAKNVLSKGLSSPEMITPDQQETVLGLGLEGGIFFDDDGQMWTTVWCAVTDESDKIYLANGARFKVDKIVADGILKGQEMGYVVSDFFQGRPIKTQEGLIGVITKNFVDRTEEYSSIARLALGIWHGRDWQADLK